MLNFDVFENSEKIKKGSFSVNQLYILGHDWEIDKHVKFETNDKLFHSHIFLKQNFNSNDKSRFIQFEDLKKKNLLEIEENEGVDFRLTEPYSTYIKETKNYLIEKSKIIGDETFVLVYWKMIYTGLPIEGFNLCKVLFEGFEKNVKEEQILIEYESLPLQIVSQYKSEYRSKLEKPCEIEITLLLRNKLQSNIWIKVEMDSDLSFRNKSVLWIGKVSYMLNEMKPGVI